MKLNRIKFIWYFYNTKKQNYLVEVKRFNNFRVIKTCDLKQANTLQKQYPF